MHIHTCSHIQCMWHAYWRGQKNTYQQECLQSTVRIMGYLNFTFWLLFIFYCSTRNIYYLNNTHKSSNSYIYIYKTDSELYQWENFEARDLSGHPQHCSRRGTWPQNSALPGPLSKITQALLCNFCSGRSLVPAYQMRPESEMERELASGVCVEKKITWKPNTFSVSCQWVT